MNREERCQLDFSLDLIFSYVQVQQTSLYFIDIQYFALV